MGEYSGRNQVDFATLTVSSAAVGLKDASPSIDAGRAVHRAIIDCETDSIRWRTDGTAPTATVGMPLHPGQALEFMDQNYYTLLRNIQLIRITTDATLSITYFE